MRVEFGDDDLRRLYVDESFRFPALGVELVRQFRKAVQLLHAAEDERDLYALRGLRLEKLVGDRTGQHSVRLNKQWRLILRFVTRLDGRTVVVVEVVDYH